MALPFPLFIFNYHLMKKIITAIALLFCLVTQAFAADPGNTYRFSLDLTKVKDDRLMITLMPPLLPQGEVVYHIPKIVPGTYEVYDFGRFVHDLKAYDKNGKELAVNRTDENSWKLADGRSVAKLTYWVEDTYDTKDRKNFVFEPAGTNIEDSLNFMLNTHGFFGYFQGMKSITYQLDITRPSGFYGSTGISDIKYNGNVDTYTIPSYMELVDSPIMYSKPDTAMVDLGDARVLVSVYSPTGKVSSKFIADNIREILQAQRAYLGGKLPIEKYAFLFYFYRGMSGSGASGALEHSNSSVYYLPEMPGEYLAQMVRDVAAHEFFHIVTPLTIHSEEIGDFDYINPSMSKHLWLYEGVTEYSAGHVQVKHGLMSPERYIEVIRAKMIGSQQYNDTVPFTVMSKGCLDKYKEQYGNVYEKGALIGMCLDIKLRHLSSGAYGVQELMRDLAKTYGKEKSFRDDELISQIVKLTYPEIGEFFKKYVAGPEKLPYAEILALAGYEYKETDVINEVTLGDISLGYNPNTGAIIIFDTSEMNEFGKKMGYKDGDQIVKFNKTDVTTPERFKETVDAFKASAKAGDKLEIIVLRRNDKGKEKKVKLKAAVEVIQSMDRFVIKPIANPTEKQLLVRKAWLGQ